jgi:hypothetical protein
VFGVFVLSDEDELVVCGLSDTVHPLDEGQVEEPNHLIQNNYFGAGFEVLGSADQGVQRSP